MRSAINWKIQSSEDKIKAMILDQIERTNSALAILEENYLKGKLYNETLFGFIVHLSRLYRQVFVYIKNSDKDKSTKEIHEFFKNNNPFELREKLLKRDKYNKTKVDMQLVKESREVFIKLLRAINKSGITKLSRRAEFNSMLKAEESIMGAG